MKVGFIGLGIMGKPMCKNLIKAGYQLVVRDTNVLAVEELVQFGATAADSPREVADECSIIITMLPNSPDIKAVVCGEEGILKGAKEGLVIVDMSSIAPLISQEIAKVCMEKGVWLLDAPVSGGEPKAIDGTLSIMVGGNKSIFEKIYDLLMKMGTSVVYCGESGAGNTTKLANQVIVALNIVAVSEAFMLAKKAGVNPEIVFDAIKGGLAGSTVMSAKGPMILEGEYKAGFKIDLHAKDLNNVLNTADEVGAPIPFTRKVIEILEDLKQAGYGEEDHSGIARYYEKLVGGGYEAIKK